VSNAPNIILSVARNGLVVYLFKTSPLLSSPPPSLPFDFQRFANRDLLGGDAKLLIGKYIYTAVLEGMELKELMNNLFTTKKSFSSEVKLVEQDIWLALNVGIINENLATIVATGIFFFFFFFLAFVLSHNYSQNQNIDHDNNH
jgi:hypothetical protein